MQERATRSANYSKGAYHADSGWSLPVALAAVAGILGIAFIVGLLCLAGLADVAKLISHAPTAARDLDQSNAIPAFMLTFQATIIGLTLVAASWYRPASTALGLVRPAQGWWAFPR